MSDEKSMTRREALKKMGVVAAGIGLGIGGVNAVDVLGLSEKEEKHRKMKVLAINGSSRKDGNTTDMLNLVLGELEKEGYETEHIQLAGNTINPCKACFACAGNKNCVFGDDIFQELYRKMTEADAIILGSSTYSADVSTTLKALSSVPGVVSDTNPGMFRHKVAVRCRRPACRSHEHHRHHQPFLSQQGDVRRGFNLLEHRLWASAGEAIKDEEGVANMKNLGQNIAWLLKRIK